MSGAFVLLVRLVISMAVVMLVMALAARLVRRRQGLGGRGTSSGDGNAFTGGKLRAAWAPRGARRARPVPPVEVLFRRSLAKGANLTLVKAGGKQYLLGVTEQSVNLLTELTPTPEHSGGTGADLEGQWAVGGRPELSGTPDLSGLEGLEDIEQWQKTGRTPVSLTQAATPGQPTTAWKLAIDSLRERTVRR